MIQGTKSADMIKVFERIPLVKRKMVTEVTMDMAQYMESSIRNSFPCSTIVTDRFHVQQLVSEAVQEIRIESRREALKEENEEIKKAREEKKFYQPVVYTNGDTKKQLLARSRYLLFKPENQWHDQQKERAEILFNTYPQLKIAYDLSMEFRYWYEKRMSVIEAKAKLNTWYEKVKEKKIEAFLVPMESISLHEETILNYFINRSTNASAESFNAKLKNFRTMVRGVIDKKFHLFRVAKLYS